MQKNQYPELTLFSVSIDHYDRNQDGIRGVGGLVFKRFIIYIQISAWQSMLTFIKIYILVFILLSYMYIVR